jgi:hypothetical protein
MKDKLINILQLFKYTNIFNISFIGSFSQKDIDLVIIGKTNNVEVQLKVLNELLNSINSNGFDIINKHSHRRLLSSNKIVHLLYYPTINHLIAWESPSFIAYLHDKANWLNGECIDISDYYKKYRNRISFTASNNILKQQLFHYEDIFVTNYIYIHAKVKFQNYNVYLENIIYAIRFTITEILIESTLSNEIINFWDFDELVNHLNSLEDFAFISHLLKSLRENKSLDSLETLAHICSSFIIFIENMDRIQLNKAIEEFL